MKLAVIGLGYGDEGKGLVTDYLCEKNGIELVVRFSGGHQAGHTVVRGDKRHIFSNVGSGALLRVPTYWSEFCTFDPVGLYRELQELGDDVQIWIDPACPVVTPYDKAIIAPANMTCGVGHNEARQRQEKCSFRAIDLTNQWVTFQKLQAVRRYYNESDSVDVTEFLRACYRLTSHEGFRIGKNAVPHLLNPRILFEGSQGLMLDKKIGFYPFVTNSDVDRTNLDKMGVEIDEWWLVTRAYSTRHGAGPMFDERSLSWVKDNPDETNVYNEHQGHFRQGMLEVELLKYAIEAGGIKSKRHVVVTCLDQMKEYNLLYKGGIRHFSDPVSFLHFIKNALLADEIYGSFGPSATGIIKF